MVSEGSKVLDDGVYDFMVETPADLMSQGQARFVWDFTRTESAHSVDSVTTNALVTAVLVETELLVGGMTVIFRQANAQTEALHFQGCRKSCHLMLCNGVAKLRNRR